MINKHMKTCSASLIIRQIQIKMIMEEHFTPTRVAIIKANKQKQKIICVDEDMDRVEPLCIADGNVRWYSYCGKQCDGFLNIELAYDPVIPLLGIYPKEWKIGV